MGNEFHLCNSDSERDPSRRPNDLQSVQWLAGLMQDSEPGSDAKIKDYFVNAVHISGDNYDKLKASLIKQAASLKSRVTRKCSGSTWILRER